MTEVHDVIDSRGGQNGEIHTSLGTEDLMHTQDRVVLIKPHKMTRVASVFVQSWLHVPIIR